MPNIDIISHEDVHINMSSSDDEKDKSGNANNAAAATANNGDGNPKKEKEEKKKKKKKPMQHLLAGGTAGLVESSVCHPLDTIKTRMQLRRQNTLRGRALGSMRDATTAAAKKGGGDGPDRASAGALHRTTAASARGGAGAAAAATSGGGAKNDDPRGGNSIKGETARAKPDLSGAKSAAAANATADGAVHDVGWKRRLPSATAAGEAASETASSSSSSARNAASSAAKSSTSASSSSSTTVVVAPLGPFGTARRIVEREGPMALYKGLTAVYTGIVPKMAIRFVSFEYYRDALGGWYGRYGTAGGGGGATTTGGAIAGATADATAAAAAPPPGVTFLAGLLSGLTEAVLIVTPAEVCKIRMQSQYHSLMDPTQRTHAKYKNVVQTAVLVAREEGPGALYKGVVPTMLRQGCNQAVNFTAYNWSKKRVLAMKRKKAEEEEGEGGSSSGASDEVQLDHWQSLLLGGLSGGMGPLVNNPLDVVKTRMQKQVIHPGKEPKYKSLLQSCVVIAKEEGTPALWKGITPRLMRIMPGQAITFMTYEAVSARMENYGLFD